MISRLLSTVFCTLLTVSLFAQIPDGSTAPNFTLTDFDGTTHTLYDVLEDDRSVIIDFSATWCGICWNYHQGHAIEDTYQTYGPSGMNTIMAYFIEADANTNDACITDDAGCSSSSIGDWTAGTSYPVFNLTGSDLSVKTEFGISGYPTIIAIAPNKKLYETGKLTAAQFSSWITETLALSAVATTTDNSIDLTVENGSGTISFNWSNGETTEDISDLSQGTYSVTITEGRGHSIELIDIEIQGASEPVVISCPSDFSVHCNLDLSAPAYNSLQEYINAGGTVSGDYDEDSFVLMNEQSNGSSCPEIVTRTYGVSNNDGDLITCDQFITISDEISPTIVSPADMTIDENDIGNSLYISLNAYITAGGNAQDNCDIDNSSFSLLAETTSDLPCPTLTRTYIIADLCGNTATAVQQLDVNLSANAMISYTNDMVNKTVTFFSSSNFADEYSWDFGDGNTSTQVNPVHEFTDFGTYTVCLTGSVSCGEKTTCKNLVISDAAISLSCPANLNISCDLSLEAPIYGNLQDYINAGGSVSGNVDESSFEMVFEESDGNICPEIVTRTYEISNGNGIIASCDQTITINDIISPVVISPSDLTLSSDEVANSLYGSYDEFINAGGFASDNCAIDEVSFSLLSEVSDDMQYCENITRIYVVNDICGNSTTVTQLIDVELLPTAALSYSSIITALQVDFTSSTDFADEFSWDFGDGNNSIEENPTHVYTESGVYEICLTGTTSCGSKTTCQNLSVMVVSNDETKLNGQVSIYPSPASKEINLVIDGSLNILQIDMYSADGNKSEINILPLATQLIDVETVPAGLYFIRVQTDTGFALKKVLVRK